MSLLRIQGIRNDEWVSWRICAYARRAVPTFSWEAAVLFLRYFIFPYVFVWDWDMRLSTRVPGQCPN